MSHPSARGRVRTNTMTSKGKTLADFAVSLHKVSGTPPPSLLGSTTTLVDDCVFIFGGQLGEDAQTVQSTLYRLDLAAERLRWERFDLEPGLPARSIARSYHTASSYDSKLFVCSGRDDSSQTPFEELAIFDCITLRWMDPLAPRTPSLRRDRHVSVVTRYEGDAVLVVLGGTDRAGNEIATAQLFDLDRLDWMHTASLRFGGGLLQSNCGTVAVDSSNFFEDDHSSASSTGDEDDKIITYTLSDSAGARLDIVSLSPDVRVDGVGQTALPQLLSPRLDHLVHHLILFGMSRLTQVLEVWVLDLDRSLGGSAEEWKQIEIGKIGLLWEGGIRWKGSVVLLHRDLRTFSKISLSPFGIVPLPPKHALPSPFSIELLNDASLNDFVLVTSDGDRLGCSRAVLSSGWDWFKDAYASSDDRALHLPQLDTAAAKLLLEYLYSHQFSHLVPSVATLSALLLFNRAHPIGLLKGWVVYSLYDHLREADGGSRNAKLVEAKIWELAMLAGEKDLMARALRLMMEVKSVRSPELPRPRQKSRAPPTRVSAPLTDSSRRSSLEAYGELLDSFPFPDVHAVPIPLRHPMPSLATPAPITYFKEYATPLLTPPNSAQWALREISPPPQSPLVLSRSLPSVPRPGFAAMGTLPPLFSQPPSPATSSASTPISARFSTSPGNLKTWDDDDLIPSLSRKSSTSTTLAYLEKGTKKGKEVKEKKALIKIGDLKPPARPYTAASPAAGSYSFYTSSPKPLKSPKLPKEKPAGKESKPGRLGGLSGLGGGLGLDIKLTSGANSTYAPLQTFDTKDSSSTSSSSESLGLQRSRASSSGSLADNRASHPTTTGFFSAFRMQRADNSVERLDNIL